MMISVRGDAWNEADPNATNQLKDVYCSFDDSEDDLNRLKKIKNIGFLQFDYGMGTNDKLRILNEIIERDNPIVSVIINSWDDNNKEFLSFLNKIKRLIIKDSWMRENEIDIYSSLSELKELEYLSVESFVLENYSFINDLPKSLLSLELVVNEGVEFDLESLLKFKLKHLSLLSRDSKARLKSIKNMDSISHFKSLELLSLYSITLKDVSVLNSLENLKKLKIVRGNISDLSLLKLQLLSHLELSNLNKMTSIDFIERLENLESLYLEEMKHIEKLPSFNSELKYIKVHRMKLLTDYSSLNEISSLETFIKYGGLELSFETLKNILEKNPKITVMETLNEEFSEYLNENHPTINYPYAEYGRTIISPLYEYQDKEAIVSFSLA